MGMYSIFKESAEFAPDMKYATSSGLYQAMYENAVNENAIFEAIIRTDLQEASDIKNGTLLESEILSIRENGIKELVTTMGLAVKRMIEKFLGFCYNIIHTVVSKLKGDSKTFIDMVEAKVKDKDLSGFTISSCYIGDVASIKPGALSTLKDKYEALPGLVAQGNDISTNIAGIESSTYNAIFGVNVTDPKKAKADIRKSFFTLKKDYKPSMTEMKEQYAKCIENYGKSFEEYTKELKALGTAITNQIKSIKETPNGEKPSDDAQSKIKALRAIQTSMNEIVGSCLSLTKELARKQLTVLRAILTQMAMYNPKKGKVEIKVDATAAGDAADASVGEACVEGEVAESMLEMDAIYDVNAMFESTNDLDNE